MREIVKNDDLGIPYTNVLNRWVVDIVKKMLGIDKLNLLYDAVYDFKGVECAKQVLNKLEINISLDGDTKSAIPETGPFIVIANHPHGALDGIILADLIMRKRPDAKFMGNFLLEKVEPMKDMFLSVNPFNSKASRNVPGIRAALKHLQEGHGLVIFPAGEVSTYYKGSSVCEDKPWEDAIMKFIRAAKVPVIPLHISGQNSKKFHFFGKIHPLLRTARLPLELLNKKGKSIQVTLGSQITLVRQQQLRTLEQYKAYLRANVYYLAKPVEQAPKVTLKVEENSKMEQIAKPVERSILLREIESLSAERCMLTSGEYKIYCAPANEIPNTLNEICRLRELTFREVGEGTGKSLDRDRFDDYYYHLFVWNTSKQEIIGAYRAGFGAKIIKEYSIEGFYTNTLFEYSSKFTEILQNSIELGRSFIVPEYQKQIKSLLFLWQGILSLLLNNKEYKYLLGPVSMSGVYSDTAKVVAMNYIKEHHWGSELAKMVIPRNGLKDLEKIKLDSSLMKDISDIGLVDKLLMDLDKDRMPLPILIKKYIQLGGVVLSFNVDPNFSDCLDSLVLLDISKVPVKTLEMLSKEYGMTIDYSRFNK